MKHIYFLTLSFVIALASFANPIDSVKTNGNWTATSTWTLNRVPQDGDTVVIPAGKTVTVNNNLDLTSADIYVKVLGTLNLAVGKLNLGSGSSVNLVNAASTIVTNQGNNSDRITINGVTKYSGVEGLMVGPALAVTSPAASPVGFSSSASSTLPIKFESFTATAAGKQARINWSTSVEINTDVFIIEKSADGRNFTQIGKIKAAGNSVETKNYNFTDELAQSSFYRVREMDIDGKSTYTSVQFVKAGQNAQTIITANNGTATVRFNSTNNIAQIRIINLNGQVLKTVQASTAAGVVVIPTNLNGAHIIAVEMQDGSRTATQVML